MPNSKIRHWVYLAIGFLILVSGAWFLLMRESKITEESASEIYSAHQKAFEDVASYLIAKEANIDIAGIPTIDNDYGIPYEQSQAYEAFCNGIYEIMGEDIREIIAEGDTVRFLTPKSGGFLVQTYLEIAAGNAPVSVNDAPRGTISGKWYYYIVKGD